MLLQGVMRSWRKVKESLRIINYQFKAECKLVGFLVAYKEIINSLGLRADKAKGQGQA